MRALTVRQPWAWAIMHGGKDVENRSRNIAGSYRGPVAIHAGLGWANEGVDLVAGASGRSVSSLIGTMTMQPRGFILGTVDLVDVHLCKRSTTVSFKGQPCCFKNGVPTGQTCSTWANPPAPSPLYHLELANPIIFDEPIPAKGRLGLWNWDEANA